MSVELAFLRNPSPFSQEHNLAAQIEGDLHFWGLFNFFLNLSLDLKKDYVYGGPII